MPPSFFLHQDRIKKFKSYFFENLFFKNSCVAAHFLWISTNSTSCIPLSVLEPEIEAIVAGVLFEPNQNFLYPPFSANTRNGFFFFPTSLDFFPCYL